MSNLFLLYLLLKQMTRQGKLLFLFSLWQEEGWTLLAEAVTCSQKLNVTVRSVRAAWRCPDSFPVGESGGAVRVIPNKGTCVQVSDTPKTQRQSTGAQWFFMCFCSCQPTNPVTRTGTLDVGVTLLVPACVMCGMVFSCNLKGTLY